MSMPRCVAGTALSVASCIVCGLSMGRLVEIGCFHTR